MAVIQKRSSGNRTIILLVFLALVAGAAVWVFFFRDRASSTAIVGVTPLASAQVESIKPDVARDLFRDPRFGALRIFAKLPIEIGPVGRANPFAGIFNNESRGTE